MATLHDTQREFDTEACDPDKLRDPLGAGIALAASFDAEFAPASGSVAIVGPGGVEAKPTVRAERPRAGSGERARVTPVPDAKGPQPKKPSEFWSGHRSLDGTDGEPSPVWTPRARMIDAQDQHARKRRKRRHGRERGRSEPMSACARYEADSRVRLSAAEFSKAWSKFIDKTILWIWFCTFTFKSDVSVERALELFDQWWARLSEAVRQKSKSTLSLTCVVAIEWTHANRVHLHAVVAGPGLDDHRRIRWQHYWEGLHYLCGMARILPAQDRASSYLGKYLGKGGILVLRGRFPRWHAPQMRERQRSKPD